MSHFTVLVIGDNVEKQLQPFHEFECTGTNDEFVQDIDVTEECREHGLDWHGLEDLVVASESEVDRNGAHQFGYAVMEGGQLIKAVNRTNPNKKWDWWQVGGRWSGYFKLKPGAIGSCGESGFLGSCRNTGADRADQVRKGDIDVEGMRAEAAATDGRKWDEIRAITGDLDDLITWTETRERFPGDIEAARAAYHSQRAKQAIANADDKDHRFAFLQLDDFKVSRDVFTRRAADSAISTFAVLKDGRWYERGDMGWFGFVADEKDPDAWNREFAALIDGLPNDTLLTVVDCHI
ncbi:hypothetical protein ABRP17_016405 [Stenotrophomonas sp. WHRI 8082]|uniref:hypothetical protein n=1 Tax=Stenotrophomonas sp. WHRI 8082 TaxID=3162571 RepID=UPI0032EF281F